MNPEDGYDDWSCVVCASIDANCDFLDSLRDFQRLVDDLCRKNSLPTLLPQYTDEFATKMIPQVIRNVTKLGKITTSEHVRRIVDLLVAIVPVAMWAIRNNADAVLPQLYPLFDPTEPFYKSNSLAAPFPDLPLDCARSPLVVRQPL
jgi:hypothetical protein